MSTEKVVMPDYLFEASWEVCNKVGGYKIPEPF